MPIDVTRWIVFSLFRTTLDYSEDLILLLFSFVGLIWFSLLHTALLTLLDFF